MRTAIVLIQLGLCSFILSGCSDANNEAGRTDSTQVNKVDTMIHQTPVTAEPTDTTKTLKDPAEKPISQLIKVDNPSSNALISSPLMIKGEAVGYWYFEADFPIRLYDANDSLIATAIAMANGEWMTENFVPFAVTMTFKKPSTKTGKLVFEKSNPSGLKEHERSFTIPVRF